MDTVLLVLQNKQPKLCVLSTISVNSTPESAVVGYAVQDDLTLVISTKRDTRKCANIKSNKNVSFVTGWSFAEKNIQIEGTAVVVDDKSSQTYQELDGFFFSQNPDARKFRSEDTVFIVVTPTWYRLLDLTVLPPTQEEKTV